VYTKTVIKDAMEVTATSPIQTKHDVVDLVPFTITGRTPFVVSAGQTVTVTGTGFHSTMTMALGGAKVLGLKVASEESASFVAPIQLGFGIVDLAANQDGIEQTVTLLYRGVSTDLPIITLTEPEVCSEYQYYDITGALKTGTRGCAAASLTDNDRISGTTSTARPYCWRDGQTDCVTTDRFKSADTDPLAISSWDIRYGKMLGGIRGRLKFCKNSANLGVFDESTSPAIFGVDKYDTIDDDNNGERGLPEEIPFGLEDFCDASAWSAGGIDSTTMTGYCNDADDQCTYQDMLTGLIWSEAAPVPVTWLDALVFCTGTISGYSDWRLPTLKELNQAAIDGIKTVSSDSFLTIDNASIYWSATTNSSATTQGWTVNLAVGAAESEAKSNLKFAACVRH
jgi:hypothetical protein